MKKNYLLLCISIIIEIGQVSLAQAPNIQWQKALGGNSVDMLFSIQQTADGGYVAAGTTLSNDGDVTGNHGGADIWVVKLDATGLLQWQKTLGGSSSDGAEGKNSILQTTDGGYIVAGYTLSNDGDVTGNHGSADMWVVKLDNTGTIQWQKTFGGTSDDGAYSVLQTTDGGYVVAGYAMSNDGNVTGNHGNYDTWIIKIDGSGILQWQKTFGGTSSDQARMIQQTNDGGFVVVGNSSSNNGNVTGNHGEADIWVIKLDATGLLQWQKAFGGTEVDEGYSIKQTTDNGYIFSGRVFSNDGDVTGNHGSSDGWVVKLNSSGVLEWQKTFGGLPSEIAHSANQLSDGSYLISITGFSLLKISSLGVLQWQKDMGGTQSETPSNAFQTTDNGIIAGGYTQSSDGDVTGFHGAIDFWVVKLEPVNDCGLFDVSVGVDEHMYFGYTPEQCKTKTVTLTGGTSPFTFNWTLDRVLLNNETLTGNTTSTVTLCLLDTAELCVTVTDANGCTSTDCATMFAEDVRCFAGNSSNQKIKICHNGNTICVDQNAVNAHLTHGDYVGPCTATVANLGEAASEENSRSGFNIYPNPSNGEFTISLNLVDDETKKSVIQIINISGQVVKQIKVYEQHKLNINLKETGVYFIRLITNKQILTKKVTVIQ